MVVIVVGQQLRYVGAFSNIVGADHQSVSVQQQLCGLDASKIQDGQTDNFHSSPFWRELKNDDAVVIIKMRAWYSS